MAPQIFQNSISLIFIDQLKNSPAVQICFFNLDFQQYFQHWKLFLALKLIQVPSAVQIAKNLIIICLN